MAIMVHGQLSLMVDAELVHVCSFNLWSHLGEELTESPLSDWLLTFDRPFFTSDSKI